MSVDNIVTSKNRADRRKEAKAIRSHESDHRKYRIKLAHDYNRKLRAQGVEKRAEANRVKSAIRREAKKKVIA